MFAGQITVFVRPLFALVCSSRLCLFLSLFFIFFFGREKSSSSGSSSSINDYISLSATKQRGKRNWFHKTGREREFLGDFHLSLHALQPGQRQNHVTKIVYDGIDKYFEHIYLWSRQSLSVSCFCGFRNEK